METYLLYWAAIIAGTTQRIQCKIVNFEKIWESVILKLHNVRTMEELREKYADVSPESKKQILNNTELWKSIDLLILSDIGYNKTFKTLFSDLKQWDIPIAYFDHHTHDMETQEFFSKYCRVYIVDKNRCATQIVHEFFLPEDNISLFISNLGADTDFNGFQMEYSQEIMAIIQLLSKKFCEIKRNCETLCPRVKFQFRNEHSIPRC